MATTKYTGSIHSTYDNLYYRTKCVYTVTTNAGNVVVSGTVQLQYKGTYKAPAAGLTDFKGGAPALEFGSNSSAYGKSTTSTSKSDWTNLGSNRSFSYSVNRETTQKTVPFKIGVCVGYSIGIITNSSFGTYTSVNVDIPALQSWDVTYAANGGSGAPGTGKKYYGKTYTIPNTKPTRSNYVFWHWNTNNSNTGTTYNSGDNYTTNAALSLYAIWNPIISYNGNGVALDASVFASQTKTYGTNLTLRSNVPQREGYVFNGWNTAADGTGTAYVAGGTYTANTPATLYAQWLSLPVQPQITSMSVIRWTGDLSTGQADDEGTSAKVTVTWSVDTTSDVYPNNTGTVTGTITPQVAGGIETSFSFSSGASGTSGTAIALITNLDTELYYVVRVVVTDQNSYTAKNDILTSTFFVLDFKAGGKGIGFGRTAPQAGLWVGYETTFFDKMHLYLDVDSSASKTTPATSGEDKDLFNAIRDLGWYDDVIDGMLSIKKLLTKNISSLRVITSGNWKYLQIGSLFIGAYSATGQLTITTQVGQVYQTAGSSTITLPITLTSNLYSNVTVRTVSYSVWPAIYGSNATTIQYRVLSANSRATATYNIKAFTIGIV